MPSESFAAVVAVVAVLAAGVLAALFFWVPALDLCTLACEKLLLRRMRLAKRNVRGSVVAPGR